MNVTPANSYFIAYESSEDESGWITVVDGLMVKEPDSGPECPPECWNSKPVDGDRAMAAVRAMCG